MRGQCAGRLLLPEIDRLFLKVSLAVLDRGSPATATATATSAAGVRFTPTAVRSFTSGVLFVEYVRAARS